MVFEQLRTKLMAKGYTVVFPEPTDATNVMTKAIHEQIGSPLGWFEVSGLAEGTVARLKPFVATWKRHRDRLHAGVIHPIGAKPDGVAWTGFVVAQEGCRELDAILFRELNEAADFAVDLRPYSGGRPIATCEVLSPRSKATGRGTVLAASVPEKLDFVWGRVVCAKGG